MFGTVHASFMVRGFQNLSRGKIKGESREVITGGNQREDSPTTELGQILVKVFRFINIIIILYAGKERLLIIWQITVLIFLFVLLRANLQQQLQENIKSTCEPSAAGHISDIMFAAGVPYDAHRPRQDLVSSGAAGGIRSH